MAEDFDQAFLRLWPRCWSPDGRLIVFDDKYVAQPSCPECDVGSLYTMRADGSGRRSLGVVGEEPRWSPDGRRLAFWRPSDCTSTGCSVVTSVLDLRTTTSHEVVVGSSAVWLPDGKSLLFVQGGPGASARTLACVELATRRVRVLRTGRWGAHSDSDPDVTRARR